MKKDRSLHLFSFCWILLATWMLFIGAYQIYYYATPGLLWVMMIPIAIAYANISVGIICMFIGVNLLKKRIQWLSYMIPLTIVMIIYLIIWSTQVLYYMTEIFVLSILIFITLRKFKIKKIIPTQKSYWLYSGIIFIIGLIPYILAKVTSYNSFAFLHNLH